MPPACERKNTRRKSRRLIDVRLGSLLREQLIGGFAMFARFFQPSDVRVNR